MFPIRDENPSRKRPLMTLALIGLNLAGFYYELCLTDSELTRLFQTYGLVPLRYAGPWQKWIGDSSSVAAWFSSMFLHGSLLHLAGNLWTLWIFGDNVEEKLGRVKYLLFYLACGLAAGMAQIATNRSSPLPMIGASGAIAGVMGAYLLFFPKAKVLVLIPVFFWPVFVKWPALVFMGIWIFIQYFNGSLALTQPDKVAGVAWWAHIGGFGAGMALGPFLALMEKGDGPGNAKDG